ncbi:MAG: LPS export ABC transporter periplasmic protein LptC [bacterium]|nr:LPS export ABC transporter periplasmic protein LptC [bacterium]
MTDNFIIINYYIYIVLHNDIFYMIISSVVSYSRFQFFLFLLFINFFCSGSISSTGNIEIKADIFELDNNKNIVAASGNVVVTQYDVKVLGKHGRYNQKTQNVYLYDGVKIEKGDMTMTCEEVVAYGKEEKMDATGKVKFFLKDITGTAEKAEYDIKLKKIRLTGNPQVQKDKDTLSGNTIWIYLDTGKLITKGRARIILSESSVKK